MEPPRLIPMVYITTKAGALSSEALTDMFLDFQNILPPIPYHEDTWRSACVSRNLLSGQFEVAFSSADLPGVETIWHPRMVDSLDIERTKDPTLSAEEMIAKMTRFHWEVQYMKAETRMYQLLAGRGIAPEFIAHVHEAGRVIGFLLEKIRDGRNAEPPDLEYNFIICPDGRVVLIDFDKARPCTNPALMEAEIESLEAQLAETTGRGVKTTYM
ncbi:alpha-galactosidase A [Nemania sp. NC0429]|nr:alpha-galactosidase A [Nemania sp. NC0429]